MHPSDHQKFEPPKKEGDLQNRLGSCGNLYSNFCQEKQMNIDQGYWMDRQILVVVVVVEVVVCSWYANTTGHDLLQVFQKTGSRNRTWE